MVVAAGRPARIKFYVKAQLQHERNHQVCDFSHCITPHMQVCATCMRRRQQHAIYVYFVQAASSVVQACPHVMQSGFSVLHAPHQLPATPKPRLPQSTLPSKPNLDCDVRAEPCQHKLPMCVRTILPLYTLMHTTPPPAHFPNLARLTSTIALCAPTAYLAAATQLLNHAVNGVPVLHLMLQVQDASMRV